MSALPLLELQTPPQRRRLKRRLDHLHRTLDRSYLQTDPLAFVHRVSAPHDREIVGFLAAALAFGNVRAIQGSLTRLLPVLGESPGTFIDGFDPVRHGKAFGECAHRWIRGADVVSLFVILRRMRSRCGSIGGFFMQGYRPRDTDIGASLDSFCQRALALAPDGPGAPAKFFPSPRGGSACKRLNLYLRWMVRDGDGLDLGLWPGVARRQLVLPLDTHLVRLTRALGLTSRRSPGWAMAVQATRSLALLDPEDPVKYDFSLSRLGILDLCLHGRDPIDCRRCPAARPRVIDPAGARARRRRRTAWS